MQYNLYALPESLGILSYQEYFPLDVYVTHIVTDNFNFDSWMLDWGIKMKIFASSEVLYSCLLDIKVN